MTSTGTGAGTLSLREAQEQGFVVPPRVTARARPSERVPALYPLAVRGHRVRRHLAWLTGDTRWATGRGAEQLPVRSVRHSSLLMRELAPDQMRLQRNKVVNLRLAADRTDGLVIGPGETFSFNRVVGNCTRRRGYVEGMRLSNGVAVPGVGGGICQLANLVHWMVLHSPLTVVERSEHSFDPFPDNGRVLPWGVGCSIVYNYVDLVVRNDTELTFGLRTWVDERHLRGELRVDRPTTESYRVGARAELFLEYRGRYFRKNEIWRTVICKRTGNVLREDVVKRNCALVTYRPDPAVVMHVVD